MIGHRLLSSSPVKVIALICASICAWYLGYYFAEILPEDSIQTAIGSMQHIGERPVVKAPPPMRQKCSVWRTCKPSEFVFRIRSGSLQTIRPEICVEDHIVLGEKKQTGDRGFNFVVIHPATLKVTETQTFDMYAGDFAGEMVKFINKIPNGFIIMVASQDDASSKLNEEAKKAFESLGSKEIRNIKFRSGFVFVATKGAKLPENIEKEKVIHVGDNNRYEGWPAEIQIEGCLPRK